MPSTSGPLTGHLPAQPARRRVRARRGQRATGGSRGVAPPAGTAPHHQGVGAGRLVVAAPDADLGEPAPLVQPLRPVVVHPDFEKDVAAATPGRLGQQGVEQRGADPLPPAILGHGEGEHVRLPASGGEQARVANQPAGTLGHQVIAAAGHPVQLGGEHPLGPCLVAEQVMLQPEHRGQVGPGHRAEHDGRCPAGPDPARPGPGWLVTGWPVTRPSPASAALAPGRPGGAGRPGPRRARAHPRPAARRPAGPACPLPGRPGSIGAPSRSGYSSGRRPPPAGRPGRPGEVGRPGPPGRRPPAGP